MDFWDSNVARRDTTAVAGASQIYDRLMVAAGRVKIVGGMYDVSPGRVTFYEN